VTHPGDGWRNARRDDPDTSHWAADEIDQAHTLIVRNYMIRSERPEGWTYGEVWDATTGIDNPVEVMRRMSDLHRDGLLRWATDSQGAIIKRIWHRTGKPQQARRLAAGTVTLLRDGPAPSVIPEEHRQRAVSELTRIAAWLQRNSETAAAALIGRAARILVERGTQ
jgi:hypothetical protein